MSSAKLTVHNLSDGTTDDTLNKAFAAFGQVLDAIVMRDRDTGKSRGFGFVTFASVAEATDALANTNGQMLDGRKIKVVFFGQKDE